MDFNENNNQNIEGNDLLEKDNSLLIKEKRNGNAVIWYWIIGILILGLFGWYGYTAGWFTKDNNRKKMEVSTVNTVNNTPFGGMSDDIKAAINNVIIETSDSFPVQKTLVVKGSLEDACTYLNDPQVIRDGSTFYVNLTTRKEGDNCAKTVVPYERSIGLDVIGLPAGIYFVIINGKETMFELEQDNSIDFSSGEEK